MALNLKGQDCMGKVSTLATAPEGILEETLVCPPVGGSTLTALQVLSPMALNLKGEESEDREGEVSPLATPEAMLEAMLVSPLVGGPTLTALQVLSPLTLNLGEEVSGPSHATTDAAAFPTTTNSQNPTNATTNMGENSPKSPTRPSNAAEMPSRPGPPGPPGHLGMSVEMSTCPTLPSTRASHRRVPHVSPALKSSEAQV
jgi:hypothetical protein